MTTSRLFRITSLLAALLLGACQTESQPTELPRELRYSSVVSTSARTFDPQPGARIRWRSDIAVHAPEGTPPDPAQLAFIRSEVETRLQEKGYAWTADNQSVDYLVQGVIVLGNELNETTLRDILGFDPGLVANDTDYQKGSLLLLLLNPANNQTQWRAAVEILTAAELPDELRRQRVQSGIASLLRPLPDVNNPQR